MGDQAARVELDSLAQQLRSVLNNPDAFAGADEAQRLEVKQLARAVSVALEQPFETVQRLAYSVRLSPLDPTSSDSPSPYAAETRACLAGARHPRKYQYFRVAGGGDGRPIDAFNAADWS